MADSAKKPQKKTKSKRKRRPTAEKKSTKDNAQHKVVNNIEKKVDFVDEVWKSPTSKPVLLRSNVSPSLNFQGSKTSGVTEKGKSPLFQTITRLDGSKKPIYGTNNALELIQPIPSSVIDEKLEEVLQAVRSVDATCDYHRCRTRTNLIGQNCDYCQKRYCFPHGLPEIHGCGNAIKLDEQKKFRNPIPLKTIKHEKEVAQAKVNLETKLRDMKISRLAKPPGKNPFSTADGSSKKNKSK